MLCRFGRQYLEDAYHIFVHCFKIWELLDEYSVFVAAHRSSLMPLSDLALLPVSVRVIIHFFRDNSSSPFGLLRFRVFGTSTPLLDSYPHPCPTNHSLCRVTAFCRPLLSSSCHSFGNAYLGNCHLTLPFSHFKARCQRESGMHYCTIPIFLYHLTYTTCYTFSSLLCMSQRGDVDITLA